MKMQSKIYLQQYLSSRSFSNIKPVTYFNSLPKELNDEIIKLYTIPNYRYAYRINMFGTGDIYLENSNISKIEYIGYTAITKDLLYAIINHNHNHYYRDPNLILSYNPELDILNTQNFNNYTHCKDYYELSSKVYKWPMTYQLFECLVRAIEQSTKELHK